MSRESPQVQRGCVSAMRAGMAWPLALHELLVLRNTKHRPPILAGAYLPNEFQVRRLGLGSP